jgi:hypothetical protein
MDIMGYATRHDLPGSPEKGFGFGSFLAVSIGIMFQGCSLHEDKVFRKMG